MAAVAPPQIQVNDAPLLPGLQSSFNNMSMKEEFASQDARATPAAMGSLDGNTHVQPSNANSNQDQKGAVDGKTNSNNNQQQNGNNNGAGGANDQGGRGGKARYRGGGRGRGGRGRRGGPNTGDRQQNGQDNGQANGGSDQNDADGDWAEAAEEGMQRDGNNRRRNQRQGRNANNNKTGDNYNQGNRGQSGTQNRVQAPGPNNNSARTSWNTVVYKSRIFTSPTHMYEPDQLRMGNRNWTPKSGGFAPPQRLTANPNMKRDFWICGFNAGTTSKEITDRLAERGIVDINYMRVLPPSSNAWWKSIRLSIRQKDVDTLLDSSTWEPWICVVPWNWDQEGQPGLGPKRDYYGNYGYDDGNYDNGNYHDGNYNNGPGPRRRMVSGNMNPLP